MNNRIKAKVKHVWNVVLHNFMICYKHNSLKLRLIRAFISFNAMVQVNPLNAGQMYVTLCYRQFTIQFVICKSGAFKSLVQAYCNLQMQILKMDGRREGLERAIFQSIYPQDALTEYFPNRTCRLHSHFITNIFRMLIIYLLSPPLLYSIFSFSLSLLYQTTYHNYSSIFSLLIASKNTSFLNQ